MGFKRGVRYFHGGEVDLWLLTIMALSLNNQLIKDSGECVLLTAFILRFCGILGVAHGWPWCDIGCWLDPEGSSYDARLLSNASEV